MIANKFSNMILQKALVVLLFSVYGSIDADVISCANNHYEELNIDRDASATEIKQAYRLAAKTYHPDKPGGSQEKFICISAAYDTLLDPAKRQIYDMSLMFMSLVGSIEDTTQGMCADRADKEACRDELIQTLRQMFTNATFEGTVPDLNENTNFHFEAVRKEFGFNSEFQDVMEQAWANFTALHPRSAKIINAMVYIHSFTVVKMLFAFYGSHIHQLWVVYWASEKAQDLGASLKLLAEVAVDRLHCLKKQLIAAGTRALIEGPDLLVGGKVFLEGLLDQFISAEFQIEDNSTKYVSVDDVFAGAKYAEIKGLDGSMFKVKCCCHSRGKCNVKRLTGKLAPWYWPFSDPDGCGTLVGSKWHSHKRLQRSCDVPEPLAVKLREKAANAKMEL